MRNLKQTETICIKKNRETIGKCKERNNGTLEENIAELEIAIGIEKRAKRVAELKSIVEVAKEIISCRVLPTRGAFDLYWKHKILISELSIRDFIGQVTLLRPYLST